MSERPILARNDFLASRANESDLYYTGLNGVNISLDRKVVLGLASSVLIIVTLVLGLRLWQLFASHLRHIYCLTATRVQQKYWSYDQSNVWPWLKRELIYAPLGKKRHNRELQLSKAHNYGTIPSRIHTVLLSLYLIGNIVFCSLLDYRQQRPALLAELRGRSGILATVNMVPLMLFAGRNNPLISLLKISFDNFNLFHRWMGRLIVAESVLHVLAWHAAYSIQKGDSAASKSFAGNTFLQCGLVAIVCMAVIALQSLSPIRHAFYETFLTIHQVLAFAAVVCVYVHMDLPKLPALPYSQLAVGLWAGDRLIRFSRLVYLNYTLKLGKTKLVITALPGEASRLTFQLPRHIAIRPGSHVYVYIPKLSLWQSHPFSVAWTNAGSEPATGLDLIPYSPKTPKTPGALEKQVARKNSSYSPASKVPTSLSLICVARSGVTRKMYDAANSHPSGSVEMTAYVEGPYAGHDSLASYGTVFLYAAGGGITHHLVQIRHLLACAHAKTVATRKIVLVWSVRDAEAFAWVRDWMDEILDMPGRRDVLKIFLYVTRPKIKKEFLSAGRTLKTIPWRCNPGEVLDQELPHRIGATMVSVCGPGAFADEVRAATRQRLGRATIDFNEESFTW